MILIDTSIWIDHLRKADTTLAGLLNTGQALCHPFVIGEIALGHLSPREPALAAICNLPRSLAATNQEVLVFIETHRLFGLDIGYVDTHLLAAVQLTAGALIWTRDRRLRNVAKRLGLAADLP